jgi:hypothetical protein
LRRKGRCGSFGGLRSGGSGRHEKIKVRGEQLGDERIETLHLCVRITHCHTHVLTFGIPQNQETLAKGREERLRRLAATP